MESLTKPVTLTQDVAKVLDEIRAGAENALYGAEPKVSEELFAKHVVSLIEGAGLPLLQTMHYRWFLRELARLWRTRTGRDLAFHLELCIRKWVGLGLEPRTLQFLVTEAHERLKAKSLETAKDAKGGDMTGLSDNTDRVPSPDSELTTKTPSHQEEQDSDTRPLALSDRGRCGQSSTPRILSDGSLPGIMAGPRPPTDPATGPLDSSNPGVLP